MTALINICYILMAAGALLGFALWFSGRLEKRMLPIVFAAAASFINEMLAEYFKIKIRDNSLVYYLGNGLEYSFYAWFLMANLHGRTIRKAVMLSIIIYVVALVAYCPVYIPQDPFTKYIEHRYIIGTTGFLLCVWCGFYFKQLFEQVAKFKEPDIPVLLIISAILFYYAFSTIFFTAQGYLITLSVKADPQLFTNAIAAKKVAITSVFKQFKDILIFLFITNVMLYACILLAIGLAGFRSKELMQPSA